MPELITIEEAARITGFPSEDIQYWAKSHKITSYSVTRDSRLVDLANLREFISHIEHLGIQKLYLQLIIEDKKEEATRSSPNTMISCSAFDPLKTSLPSLNKLPPN